MGAIAARQDNKGKPSSPRKNKPTTAIAMRRSLHPTLHRASLRKDATHDKNSAFAMRLVHVASKIEPEASERINWTTVSVDT
jgi:hypothetical protein